MNLNSDKSTYQKIVDRLKDNKPIAVALLAFGMLVGVGTLLGTTQNIWNFIEEQFFGRTTEIKTEYCELLRPLVLQFDRTKSAFDQWNRKDLSLESQTILDGNKKARDLLGSKGALFPESFQDDKLKLVLHYDSWIQEYDRVRVTREKNPDQQFVFVYSFPRDSEERIRTHMAEIQAKLGDDFHCL